MTESRTASPLIAIVETVSKVVNETTPHLSGLVRIHFLQQWFGLSDPAMGEALHDTRLEPLERLPAAKRGQALQSCELHAGRAKLKRLLRCIRIGRKNYQSYNFKAVL
jgi:hypothetical protein